MPLIPPYHRATPFNSSITSAATNLTVSLLLGNSSDSELPLFLPDAGVPNPLISGLSPSNRTYGRPIGPAWIAGVGQGAPEETPATWQTWFYGLLIVTAASFLSPLAILMVPLLSRYLYDRIMTFLVALGIGAMSGSCFFILIPQALNVTELKNVDYVTKSSLMAIALYGFFVVDRLLQYIIEMRRRLRARARQRKVYGTISTTTTTGVGSGRSTNSGTTYETSKSDGQRHQRPNGTLHLSPYTADNNDEGHDGSEQSAFAGGEVPLKEGEKEVRDEIELEVVNGLLARTLSARKRTSIIKQIHPGAQRVVGSTVKQHNEVNNKAEEEQNRREIKMTPNNPRVLSDIPPTAAYNVDTGNQHAPTVGQPRMMLNPTSTNALIASAVDGNVQRNHSENPPVGVNPSVERLREPRQRSLDDALSASNHHSSPAPPHRSSLQPPPRRSSTTITRRARGPDSADDMADGSLGNMEMVEERVVVEKSRVEVASVAYMIIFGSSANNLVDGMSTGAAFSDSVLRGVSIGLAVLSQQFPQELGTLAILVNSGLGMRRTILYNMIPIALSYLGFALGVMLDTLNESFDSFIFSVSTGMYLYIFLGTLIPEIRSAFNEILRTDLREAAITTMLQFSGIAFGVFFLYFMNRGDRT